MQKITCTQWSILQGMYAVAKDQLIDPHEVCVTARQVSHLVGKGGKVDSHLRAAIAGITSDINTNGDSEYKMLLVYVRRGRRVYYLTHEAVLLMQGSIRRGANNG